VNVKKVKLKRNFLKIPNCFQRKNVKQVAFCLRLNGFSVVPLTKVKDKFVPKGEWKGFQKNPIPLELVKAYFEDAEGVAIATGSDCVVIDVDEPLLFNSFYPIEKLKKECGLIVKTKDPDHRHLYFLPPEEEELRKNKNFLTKFGFEIKGKGGLATFFVTSGEYEVEKAEGLKPIPKELEEKLKNLIVKAKTNEIETKKEILTSKELSREKAVALAEEVLELLDPYYVKGQRQNFVLYVSGVFRKSGVPKEVALEVIENFCKERRDEELKTRLEAVKHTYEETKPEENVAGISGLIEVLGISEEDALKLKVLTRKKKLETKPVEAFKAYSAYELAKLEFKPPKWLVAFVLPEGLSILVGKPKVGKSWLALQISVDLARIGKKVVYLALEDTPGRLQKRIKTLKGENLNKLFLLFPTKNDLRIGRGGWKYLSSVAQDFLPDLLIVDPWAKIKPVAKKKEDLYLLDYEALELFKDLTSSGINVLIVHHQRKADADDPLDAVLGTTGTSAAVDNVLLLKRTRGTNAGTLEVVSRDFQEINLGLSFEEGIWKVLGDAREVTMAEEQRKVVKAIRELGGEATPKEVAEFLNKNYHTVKNQMLQMLNKGLLLKKDKGRYSPLCEEL